MPLYLLGILLLFGALLGRAVCAFLCPFGLIQELLYKIPTKKLKKSAWTRRLTVIKYIVLVVMVIALPLYFLIVNGVVTPAFCKWLCPVGTLEGGVPLLIANEGLRAQIGWLFSWKALVTAAVIAASIFIYRPFCRFLCPLGAIYSLFNRAAVFGVRLDKKKCTHCGACARACKMDVRIVNDRECLRCGECVSRCPTGACLLYTSGGGGANAFEPREDALARVDAGQFHAQRLAERGGHQRWLALAHQPRVDEDAFEPIADGAVQKRGADRRIDAAGNGDQGAAPADVFADARLGAFEESLHRPPGLAAADIAGKVGEYLQAVRVVGLGVKLQGVELPFLTGEGGHQSAVGKGDGAKALRQLQRVCLLYTSRCV